LQGGEHLDRMPPLREEGPESPLPPIRTVRHPSREVEARICVTPPEASNVLKCTVASLYDSLNVNLAASEGNKVQRSFSAPPSRSMVHTSMPLGMIPHLDAPGGLSFTPHVLASDGSIVWTLDTTTAPTLVPAPQAWLQMAATPTIQAKPEQAEITTAAPKQAAAEPEREVSRRKRWLVKAKDVIHKISQPVRSPRLSL